MSSVYHLANGDITARSASHYLARGRYYLRLRTLPILKISSSYTLYMLSVKDLGRTKDGIIVRAHRAR